ncbi:hypothetical protein GQX74_008446 [Glossina fuscipes]|nr:hypothetical protein GQX74_008446 [Glossina fuscipes]
MALSRGRTAELPKDAVIITEGQALAYQWKMISNWDKPGEVWSLRYSPPVLGSLAVFTSVFINNHYRTKLRLGTYGQFSTYLPIVIIPALLSIGCHKLFVQNSLILRGMSECPTCIQLRAAAFQVSFGGIYPGILAPFAACMFATRHFTYRLPAITEQPLEVLQLLRKFAKPILPTMGMILAGQALITIYLTYKQQKQILEIYMKMKKIEQNIETELDIE